MTTGYLFVRALLLTAVLAVLVPARAVGEETGNQQFAELINAERSRSNLPLLSPDGDLFEVAQRHSTQMAEEGRLFHNLSLDVDVSGWALLGENVGRGPRVELIHQAFMASPTHRDLILDPEFGGFAIASVSAQGEIFVTELFVLRAPVEVLGVVSTKHLMAARVATPTPKPLRPIARPAPVTVPTSLEFEATSAPATLGLRALALLLLVLDAQILKLHTKPGRSP